MQRAQSILEKHELIVLQRAGRELGQRISQRMLNLAGTESRRVTYETVRHSPLDRVLYRAPDIMDEYAPRPVGERVEWILVGMALRQVMADTVVTAVAGVVVPGNVNIHLHERGRKCFGRDARCRVAERHLVPIRSFGHCRQTAGPRQAAANDLCVHEFSQNRTTVYAEKRWLCT